MARRRTTTTARTLRTLSEFPSGTKRPTRSSLLGATALVALVGWGVFAFTTPAGAQLPTGGTVVGGTATINTGPNQVTVNQTSNRGVIDWRSFSIGQGSRVDFRQPGASSVTLNRVTGPDPSVIAGQLTANGQIVLVNGAGIVFANGAQVNVGALVASTANISNPQRFMAGGDVTFDVPSSNANAGVVNAGTITVRDGGLVGLVGNMAANNGVINARLGRVTIGGAETFTVDLAGDGLINFQIGQPVSRQPVDAQGRKVPLASNTGTINADGGVVTMTARAAGSVVDNVVNVGGAVRAQAVSEEGGVLVLGGEDGGTVNITGKLDVSGKAPGQRGGLVMATAKGGKVKVAATAVIDASGDSGGGRVNVGGSYQGKGPIANAGNVTVEPGAKVNADATGQGTGGTVIVWSDNATVFCGTITARGGPQGGNGGFAEVSGKKRLDYRGSTDLRAPLGTVGTLLLDPSDIVIQATGVDDTSGTGGDPNTISGNGATSILLVGTLQSALNDANVIVDASGGPGTVTGTITVVDPFSIPSGRTLTLTAPGAISIQAAISTPGSANLTINSTASTITSNAAGTISLGNGTLTATAAGTIDLIAPVAAAVFVFSSASGSVELLNGGNSISAIQGGGGTVVNIISSTPMEVRPGGITAGTFVFLTSTAGQFVVNGNVTSNGVSGELVSITSTGAGGFGIRLNGVTISGPSIRLNAPAGDITQTGGSVVTSGVLNVDAAGTVQLTSPTNDVGFIFGSAGTHFRYVDANNVTLGVVENPGTSSFVVRGITMGAGGYLDIAASGVAIAAETGFVPFEPARIGTAPGSVDNPTGVVVLRPTTAGAPMVIGGTSGTNLTDAVLANAIRSGTLRIGSIGRAAGTTLGGVATAAESAAGTITVQGLNLTGTGSAVQTLVLESGATGTAITQTADPLLVNTLATATLANGNVNLSGGSGLNEIGTVAHIVRISDTEVGAATGIYSVDVRFGVTIASLGSGTLPLVGLRSSGTTPGLPANTAILAGSVSVDSGSGVLQIDNAIATSGGNVTLTASPGSIVSGPGGTIDTGSGTLSMSAGSGSINLNAAPVAAGVVNFTATGGPVSLTNFGNAISAVATAPSSASSTAVGAAVHIVSTLPLTVASGGITANFVVTIASAGQLVVNGSIGATGGIGLSGLRGVLQTAGTVSSPSSVVLEAGPGASIIQTGGNIVTGLLIASAGADVQLASPANDADVLLGSAGANFRYVDIDDILLDRITIGAGGYVDIAASTITLPPPASIGGLLGSSAEVSDNPTGVVVLRPATAGTPMVIGGTGGTGLTEAALAAGIRTGTLRIGSIGRAAGTVLGGATTATEAGAGTISIAGLNLAASAINTLVLESSAAGVAIGQTGGLTVANLLAAATGSGSVELTLPGANTVRNIAGVAGGDFRLINAGTVTVPAGGVGGDNLVPAVQGVQAGPASTLELAIGSGDIVINAPLSAPGGLVLLRRVAGATGSEIILNGTSFDIGAGSPNLVVLDLTGSSALSPGNFTTLMSSMTPASGTSPIAAGPNPDGGIVLNGVNAGNATMYLVGGAGSSIGGSGTFGLLGVYVPHSNPIALTGSVRQIDPAPAHSVAAGFSEPFDASILASFYVRRTGEVVPAQTFNTCPIASGFCGTEITPAVEWWPDEPGTSVGAPGTRRIDFVTDHSVPTPLTLSSIILVNQGNEYFFNVGEEERRQRAARGGK